MTGAGFVVEFIAAKYGPSWLAWVGVIFLLLAFWSYTKHYLSAKSSVFRWGSYLAAALVLFVITFLVVGVGVRPKQSHQALTRPLPQSASNPGRHPSTNGSGLVCQVATIQLEPFYRFFQDPPVYFQRLDTAIRVDLTSQVGKPLYLQDYKVSALVGIQWIPFKNADRADFEPYAFGIMGIGPRKKYLRRFNLSASLFDYVMHNAPLGPYQNKEVWMFFISGLTRKKKADISQVRFVFRDRTRQEFVCVSPYSIKADKGIVVGLTSGNIRAMPFEPIPPDIREEPSHPISQ